MSPASLNIADFLAAKGPIVDVRSPGEFHRGHIPGAVNIPVFDDEERAQIGTVYAEKGREPAFELGFQFFSRRMAHFVDQFRQLPLQNASPIHVHCWRGGLRSQAAVWALEQLGVDANLLAGGYRSYRRDLVSRFSRPWPLVVLSGMTGAGKTVLLSQLAALGEQVVDLECLAHHRGSAFGGLGQPSQPTTQQFENQLDQILRSLDPNRRVWVEDEARAIGQIRVPQDFWCQMRKAPVLFADVPRYIRAKMLVEEYGKLTVAELSSGFQQITKRLGSNLVQQATAALQQGKLELAARIALDYYDRAYRRSASRRQLPNVIAFQVTNPHASESARQLIALAEQIPTAQGETMASVLERCLSAVG